MCTSDSSLIYWDIYVVLDNSMGKMTLPNDIFISLSPSNDYDHVSSEDYLSYIRANVS